MTHKVTGTTTIDNAAESMIVAAYAYADVSNYLGTDTSDSGDGSYEILFTPPTGFYVTLTFTKLYGKPWAATDAVAAADEIRQPTTPNGHWYTADTDGDTGATEPTWPTDGGTVVDGDITWTDEGEMDAPLIEAPVAPVEV